MNLTQIFPPCSHVGITIFEQEEEKRGISLYQTWHIVNSITLYHVTSHRILSYCITWDHILSNYHTKLHHLISLRCIYRYYIGTAYCRVL